MNLFEIFYVEKKILQIFSSCDIFSQYTISMLKEAFSLSLPLTHSCYIMKVRGPPAGSKVIQATMNRPAPVELCHKNMRFLITHNPTDNTLNSFIEVGV